MYINNANRVAFIYLIRKRDNMQEENYDDMQIIDRNIEQAEEGRRRGEQLSYITGLDKVKDAVNFSDYFKYLADFYYRINLMEFSKQLDTICRRTDVDPLPYSTLRTYYSGKVVPPISYALMIDQTFEAMGAIRDGYINDHISNDRYAAIKY